MFVPQYSTGSGAAGWHKHAIFVLSDAFGMHMVHGYTGSSLKQVVIVWEGVPPEQLQEPLCHLLEMWKYRRMTHNVR